MTSSQLCWKGPCVLCSTSTRPCLHVTVCTNVPCCMVWWVECGRVLWCGRDGCIKKKRQEAKTQSNKNKKDFSQKPLFSLFPFFHLFFFHSFLPAFHSSTITLFLSIQSSIFMFHTWVHLWRIKNTNDVTSDPFHCLFLLFQFYFPLLFSLQMIQGWLHHNQILSNHQITFILHNSNTIHNITWFIIQKNER